MRPHRPGAAKKASTWATAKRQTCVALCSRALTRDRAPPTLTLRGCGASGLRRRGVAICERLARAEKAIHFDTDCAQYSRVDPLAYLRAQLSSSRLALWLSRRRRHTDLTSHRRATPLLGHTFYDVVVSVVAKK